MLDMFSKILRSFTKHTYVDKQIIPLDLFEEIFQDYFDFTIQHLRNCHKIAPSEQEERFFFLLGIV